jgi:YVTN family beta-propeller protein
MFVETLVEMIKVKMPLVGKHMWGRRFRLPARRKPRDLRVLICSVLVIQFLLHADDMHPPGGATYAHTTGNVTILPGGRALKPIGSQIDVGPGAFGLAISPKGLIAVSLTGFERFGVSVLTPHKDTWQQNLFWAAPVDDDPRKKPAAKSPDRWDSTTYGIAWDSEKSVWIAEGDTGKIRLLDAGSGTRRKLLSINTSDVQNSYTADLTIDPVRHILYVLDQANFRLVLIDTIKDTILSSIATGRMPFTIALSPDRNTVYVANIGMFRYQVLPKPLSFPPAEPLGDPNENESNSVCVIDVHDPHKPTLVTWIRTGPPVGSAVSNGPDQPAGIAIGGSAPTGILAVEDKVYVSNAHSDSITVISAADNKMLGQIRLAVPWLLQLRGFLPAGMAYDPAKKWLLVAEAGANAVGVIDTARNVVIAHLPVGLYPTRVAIADGRVWVVNTRGRGSGANASRPLQYPEDRGSQPAFYRGTLSTFTMPPQDDLQKLTATNFAANGFFVEKSITPSFPAGIRHVVLIVKENRAFDEILGDLGPASDGQVMAHEPLARYGMHGRADGGGTRFSVKDAAITPNHHAIAKQFAFSDNFYADGDTDLDGQHWLTGVIPDLFTMSGVFATFGGQRHFSLDAPGRLLFAGTGAAMLPEEVPENGTLWDHLERNKITFRNFGAGLDLPGADDAHYPTNVPMPAALERNTSRDYPGFNLDIPDQTRTDKFIAELDQRYKNGNEPLPQFLFVTLPNDYVGEERPDRGYPFASSWVADNDLALGRILEYLSHSPWWREMAVFVTEDAAAGGIDLVDAHRTILLAAGPNVRRDYVSHTNSSFPGLLKTIFEIFRIPALNLMDQTAASLEDMFTETPDYTPYQAVPPDKKIFDPGGVVCGAGASACPRIP